MLSGDDCLDGLAIVIPPEIQTVREDIFFMDTLASNDEDIYFMDTLASNDEDIYSLDTPASSSEDISMQLQSFQYILLHTKKHKQKLDKRLQQICI